MIQTSCFRKPGLPLDRCVAISRGVPPGWKGRTCLALAPSRELLAEYKAGRLSWYLYRTLYREQVLDRLDPMQIGDYLGWDSILLCWEKDRKRCHRGLVAAWLHDATDEEVLEWRAV